MRFSPGADVVVRSLNRRGRVMDVRGDVYHVLVGAMALKCREHDLRDAGEPRPATRRRGRKASASPDGRSERGSSGPRVVRAIDLHGLTVEEARTALADFVSRAVMEGADTLEIVHGIGTGRLREAVRRELRTISAVRAVRPHPTNPGITIAEL
ncbi:MAG TPA: Smr/MutS family protein [Vicinamibacterales bacterium]|jgi:DNA mismatch repair protein MutS2|nr:Smr/MutS family protein [Vicinamibacterales bacterium]